MMKLSGSRKTDQSKMIR